MQHLLEAAIHFIFFYELAAISLGNAFADGRSKTCMFLEQAQRGVLQETLDVSSGSARDPHKLGLLFGREMKLHRFRILGNFRRRNPLGIR